MITQRKPPATKQEAHYYHKNRVNGASSISLSSLRNYLETLNKLRTHIICRLKLNIKVFKKFFLFQAHLEHIDLLDIFYWIVNHYKHFHQVLDVLS